MSRVGDTFAESIAGTSCPLISQGRPWMVTFSEKGPLRARVSGKNREARGKTGWRKGGYRSEVSLYRFQPLSMVPHLTPPPTPFPRAGERRLGAPGLRPRQEELRGLCVQGE